MKMASQRQFHYLLLIAGIVCLKIFAPKCSAEKTQGVLDSIKGFLRGCLTIQATQQQRQHQKHNASFSVESAEEVVKMVQKIPVNSVSSPTIGMTSRSRYDVFLSFRGPDVRRGFVDHLYNAMTSAGIDVFLDAHKLNKGEDISTTIKDAIESSRIRIAIFSPDYANSVWCLEEMLLIARQKHGIAVPLFYKVDPSHVGHPEQSESPFCQAFQHYQSREEIDEWKSALFTVSSLAGWSLDDTNGYEAVLVKRVVQDVCKLLRRWGH